MSFLLNHLLLYHLSTHRHQIFRSVFMYYIENNVKLFDLPRSLQQKYALSLSRCVDVIQHNLSTICTILYAETCFCMKIDAQFRTSIAYDVVFQHLPQDFDIILFYSIEFFISRSKYSTFLRS